MIIETIYGRDFAMIHAQILSALIASGWKRCEWEGCEVCDNDPFDHAYSLALKVAASANTGAETAMGMRVRFEEEC